MGQEGGAGAGQGCGVVVDAPYLLVKLIFLSKTIIKVH